MTQKELAGILGVSQMTVSRALRNHPHVDAELRERILAAAAHHGYSVEANHAAEVLRHRARGEAHTTHVLCAMIDMPQGDGDDESFQGRILKGVCERAQEINWEVVLPVRCRERTPLVVARQQVDGVVRVLRQQEADAGHPELPVPWVSILFAVKGVDSVTVDNAAGAAAVGRHLCALGHRRVAFVGPDTQIARERLAGLRRALDEVGAQIPDERVCLQPHAGNVATTILLVDGLLERTRFTPGKRPFTALVAYNDYMAVAAKYHLRARGLRVPEDVSVAGFDGALPRGFRGARVTTAAMPLERIGAESVRLLEKRILNPSVRSRNLVLETELVTGETTAPA